MQDQFVERSVRGSNPVSVLTTDVCSQNTYRPFIEVIPDQPIGRCPGPGVTTNSNYPASIDLCTTLIDRSGSPARGEGIEPSSPASKAGGLPLADPQECSARIELASPATNLRSVPEAWSLCRSAKSTLLAEGARVELARPTRHPAKSRAAGCPARPLSKRLPSRAPIGTDLGLVGLALPFKAAEAGIEPASKRLTVALPYQHRTHRNHYQRESHSQGDRTSIELFSGSFREWTKS